MTARQRPATIQIGPSILAADFRRLGDEVAEAESGGADFIHVDVMDGRFVPNLSFGLPILEAVRASTRLPIDVHLMIVEPERFVERFVAAGADIVTVHTEATDHLHGTLQAIANAGAEPGVTLNPATSLHAIEDVLAEVRQVLVMSVNPGFGGQSFITSALGRITRLRRMLDEQNPSCRIEVDGGIHTGNVRAIVDAGGEMIVAGSAIFAADASVSEALAAFRAAIA